jgi:dihydrofolate reductase
MLHRQAGELSAKLADGAFRRYEASMSHVILSAGPIARARNGIIGEGGGLPWRLKSDLAIFRAVTMGKPVIMGRKTWESLPKKPLPGRTNIVLSRDGSFQAHGAVVCEDFSEAVQIAREQAQEDGRDEVCVIGGASLFELALQRAGRLYLTEVEAEVDGDVRLAPIDEGRWREVRREHHPASEADQYPFTFRVLERL